MKELELNNKSKLFALFINISNPKENFEVTKQYFKTETPSDLVNLAQKTECDIIALKFNSSDADTAQELLKSLLPQITKPLMIYGTGDGKVDKILVPALINVLDRQAIIAWADEATYKSIIPAVIKGNHYVVLKTPIDINLAKELNILSIGLGLAKDKIIMNTDIGGLGYGYEYGFSMMEKTILEGGKGDDFLNLPIITDAAIEALKTKEAKSDITCKRARMIELAACSGTIAAGANIITVCAPENIKILKGLV